MDRWAIVSIISFILKNNLEVRKDERQGRLQLHRTQALIWEKLLEKKEKEKSRVQEKLETKEGGKKFDHTWAPVLCHLLCLSSFLHFKGFFLLETILSSALWCSRARQTWIAVDCKCNPHLLFYNISEYGTIVVKMVSRQQMSGSHGNPLTPPS